MPSNCGACYYGGNGISVDLPRPDMQIQNVQPVYRGPENGNGGGLMMMSGDVFGFSDLLGLGLASMQPEDKYAALDLGLAAILLTRG